MENSLTKAKERFELLPDDVQEAITRFDYDSVLREIQLKYRLHIDQASALEKNIADIIFGDRRASDLIGHLVQDMHIEAEGAKTIAFDVNTSILKPIQDLMKKIQTEEN